MRWFDGSIANAINSAKQQGVVFVVVIIGEDEQSAHLVSSWEDDRVSEAAHNSCVAIKVDAKSETCGQFSQIYPVVCVPSCFFIGDKGIPLEVIAGNVSAEELTTRINRVKQMHAQQNSDWTVSVEASGPVVSISPTEPASALAQPGMSLEEDIRPSAAAAATKASFSSTSDDGSCSAVTPAEFRKARPDQATMCSQTEENLDVKVERLTKKLEERREHRKKGEEENEIKKEMDRRKTGKDMQDFKKKQEDDKTKRLLEERNREKMEEKAARDRVKQQIALDRADRAARYASTQEEKKVAQQALLQAKQAEHEAFVRERSTITRIQFRLPDGSSFTNQFPSQSKLQEARQFAAQEVGERYGNFSLATMFPRREFTVGDLNKTLVELDLAPSASIVLLPWGRPANTVVQSSGGGIWEVLGTILYPLLAVWRFLSSFLFVTPPPAGATATSPPPQSNTYNNSTSVSDKPNRKLPSKPTQEKQPKDFKKDGKICRLRTQEDSEEDNNTWNGNSTQQM